jgi:hypothetical protein
MVRMRVSVKSTSIAGALGVGCALALAGMALAAASVPKPAKAYQQPYQLGTKGLGLTYVTSAASGTVIEPGAPALGSEYPVSQLFIACPKAKKNHGLVGLPFADIGFPGATFKLKHGKYEFSKSAKAKAYITGSPGGPFTMKVTFTATVNSAKSISGTVKITGGACKTKGALRYTAKLRSADTVAPGQ